MTYKVNILSNDYENLDWFRNTSKQDYLKCFDLVRAVIVDPRSRIGKPERLKYFDKEVYSRRVNHKDRMIYTIYEEEKVIDISPFKGHY